MRVSAGYTKKPTLKKSVAPARNRDGANDD